MFSPSSRDTFKKQLHMYVVFKNYSAELLSPPSGRESCYQNAVDMLMAPQVLPISCGLLWRYGCPPPPPFSSGKPIFAIWHEAHRYWCANW